LLPQFVSPPRDLHLPGLRHCNSFELVRGRPKHASASQDLRSITEPPSQR
jgi:hypothetical protein